MAGLGVGILVGLTGVGGGALMTPLLVLLFGYSPGVAVATDLLFAAVTKTCGVAVHSRAGTIDPVVLRRLLSGSLPAALAVGLGLGYLSGEGSGVLDLVIRNALGWLLLLSSMGIFCRNRLHQLGASLRLEHAEQFKRWQGGLTVAAGAFIGTAVSLTSVGAGALGAVALLYLYPFRLQGVRLVATDLAHAMPLALVAGAMHGMAGAVDWTLLGTLLTGSVPGVLVGVWLSRRFSVQWLSMAVACLLALSGIKLLSG
ncbi:sulfite exporter TauE/SafE family protein [Stutzerimonas urumqiensis]|uniref:sulfite exporter TauE/SafE family protein n=1 Tax=Stutzerimonas urumqiensis TaxID=638269 RepID=UPI003BACFB3B